MGGEASFLSDASDVATCGSAVRLGVIVFTVLETGSASGCQHTILSLTKRRSFCRSVVAIFKPQHRVCDRTATAFVVYVGCIVKVSKSDR